MRKVSWLALGCIAACVAQAIVAADNTRTLNAKDPTSGRSRLLIFSRSKDKDKAPDQSDAPAAKSNAGRVSVSEEAAAPPARSELRSGNTGTVSGRAALPRQAMPTARPQAGAATVGTRDLAPSADDDALIRDLFESDEFDPATAKPATKQQAVRAEKTSRNMASEGGAGSASLEADAGTAAAPKSDRYRDLLESNAPAKAQPSARTAVRPQRNANAIQRVSNTGDYKPNLEINPFEADEQPGKVVNARYDSEASGHPKRDIQPINATATQTLNVKPKGAATAATKASLTKKIDTAKSAAKPAVAPAAEKPAAEVVTHTVTTSSNQSPQVDVQWESKGELTLGLECQCSLIVHNSGKIPCRDLVVEANFPESVRLVDASPFPKGSSAKLEWQFANLAPGEKKVIDLTMVPTKPGELAATAQVRFTGTAATSFSVSEPKLAADVKLTPEVRIGDPASATVTVSNPGTGTAQNVVVKTTLPSGLDYKSGKEVVTEVGPLGPGESRVVRLGLIAAGGGDHILKVVAQSTTTDLETSAQASIRVLAPSLSLTASGPSLRYLNRAAKYVLTATNNSNATSDNVRISQVIEPGFDFIKADHGGRWDSQRRTVSWFIGHMEPGQSAAVELDLMPKETGEFKQQFRVTGDAGVEAASVVTTRVEGAASLVMEVKDGEDPIEVGSETVYAISVRNDGSKSAGKVSISCELPPDVELVSVDGPTQHLVESGMLIFKPVAEVAAGGSVTYKVKIKSLAAGTMKLRARLTSESIQKPLIVEEATQFYGE